MKVVTTITHGLFLPLTLFVMSCAPKGYSEDYFYNDGECLVSKGAVFSHGENDISVVFYLDDDQSAPTDAQSSLLTKVGSRLSSVFEQHRLQIPKDCLEFEMAPGQYDLLIDWSIAIESPSSVEDYNWSLNCDYLTKYGDHSGRILSGRISYSGQFKDLKIIRVWPTY